MGSGCEEMRVRFNSVPTLRFIHACELFRTGCFHATTVLSTVLELVFCAAPSPGAYTVLMLHRCRAVQQAQLVGHGAAGTVGRTWCQVATLQFEWVASGDEA